MAQQTIDTVGNTDTIQTGGQKINANFTELYGQKGAPNGTAPLDASSLVPVSNLPNIPSSLLPPIAITNTTVVASQAAMLALTAQTGDVAIRTDNSNTYILRGLNSTVLSDWELLPIPTVPVQSVAGKTGVVVLTSADVGLSNVDNTTDAEKPISAATQTALNAKVQSVAGKTGVVVLTSADVGLSNVDNTTDAGKPISAATQTALNAKENTANKNVGGGYAGTDANNEVARPQAGAAAQVAIGRNEATKRANGTWSALAVSLPDGYDVHAWSDALVSNVVYDVFNPVNAPSSGWWHLEVIRHASDTPINQWRTLRMTAFNNTSYPNGTVFTSSNALGGWTPWVRMATDEALTWITPTFVNGWTSYDTSWPAGIAKDSMGMVQGRGLARAGTLTIGTTLFTLPVGMRPTVNIYSQAVSSSRGVASFQIVVTGEVQIITFTGNGAFVGLSFIFKAA